MGKITPGSGHCSACRSTMQVETEGNPEEKKVEVVGTSSEFAVETFGKPKNVMLDPKSKCCTSTITMRVAVAIRRGRAVHGRLAIIRKR